MDKAQLLHAIREIVEPAQESDDVQVRMSADNIMRTLIICAAGMDERLHELTRDLGLEASIECMKTDFGGGAENAEHN